MTQPTPHGYPDWQRQLAQVDTVFDSVIGKTITATETRSLFYVGNYQKSRLSFDSIAGRFRVRAQFFNNSALSLAMGEYDLVVDDGGSFFHTIPNYGPWVRVRIDLGTGATHTYNHTLASANDDYFPNQAARSTTVFSESQTVAATTTVSVTQTRTMIGTVHINWRSAATDWAITVGGVDQAGVRVVQFDTGDPGPAVGSATFVSPNEPMQMNLINNDAAARSMIARVTINPFQGI